ncbi:hypothetical protein GE09DRAFT_1231269 [Coniochaeta sp. 2T2.1]|nr:hypothetical protein GE09DRAFT_1231269 [Coniochaeta sp. 2T2.1]
MSDQMKLSRTPRDWREDQVRFVLQLNEPYDEIARLCNERFEGTGARVMEVKNVKYVNAQYEFLSEDSVKTTASPAHGTVGTLERTTSGLPTVSMANTPTLSGFRQQDGVQGPVPKIMNSSELFDTAHYWFDGPHEGCDIQGCHGHDVDGTVLFKSSNIVMDIIIKIKTPFVLVGGMTGHMGMIQAQAGYQFATNRVPTAHPFNDHPTNDHPMGGHLIDGRPIKGRPINDHPNNDHYGNAEPVNAHLGYSRHVNLDSNDAHPVNNAADPGLRAPFEHYLERYCQDGLQAPSDHYLRGFRQDGPQSRRLAHVDCPAPRLPQAGSGVASYGHQSAGLTVHRLNSPYPNMSGLIHQFNPTTGGESSDSPKERRPRTPKVDAVPAAKRRRVYQGPETGTHDHPQESNSALLRPTIADSGVSLEAFVHFEDDTVDDNGTADAANPLQILAEAALGMASTLDRGVDP